MSTELLHLNVIGNILLNNDLKRIFDMTDAELRSALDFRKTRIDFEDDYSNNPKFYLFRNKLVIKLIAKYGLLENIANLRQFVAFAIKKKAEATPGKYLYYDLKFILVVSKQLLAIFEKYLRIIILEKIAFTVNNINYFNQWNKIRLLDESQEDLLDLVCGKTRPTNQISIIDSETVEIPYDLDEKYQMKLYNKKESRKNKALEIISNADNLQEVLSFLKANILQMYPSEYSEYFKEYFYSVLDSLSTDITHFKSLTLTLKDKKKNDNQIRIPGF